MNNESRIKVKQIVKEEIKSIVPNPRMLLKIALASLFESSRKNPGQFHALYYNTPSHISVEQILSESSTIQSASRYHIGEIEDESLLLDEAEQLYNRIVDTITNNCVNGIEDITSASRISDVPDIQNSLFPVENTRKIFDTRDLSQITLIYNDVKFQVQSTTKISDGSSIKPREDGSDACNYMQD